MQPVHFLLAILLVTVPAAAAPVAPDAAASLLAPDDEARSVASDTKRDASRDAGDRIDFHGLTGSPTSQAGATSSEPHAVPYRDDMENGTAGWTTFGEPGLWNQAQRQASSPVTAWYYGIPEEGHYDTGDHNWGALVSPAIDLGGLNHAGLAFWHWYDVEPGCEYDLLNVYVSTNGTEGPYDRVYENCDSAGEGTVRVNLNPYVGEVVHVAFVFDTMDELYNHHEGWYVDDVVVDEVDYSPAHDAFADAIAFSSLPFQNATPTRGATLEEGEPQPCGNIGATVWYRFTASEDVSVVAHTWDSGYDTVLAVHTGATLDGLEPLACNDDVADSLQSRVAFSAEAGTTYFFQVGGFFGDEGDLAFLVNELQPQDPPRHLDASAGPGLIYLDWDSPDTFNGDFWRYHVYRCVDVVSCDPATAIHLGSTAWQEFTAWGPEGELSCYFVTVETEYLESEPSNVACAEPLPLPDLTVTDVSVEKTPLRTDATDPTPNPVAPQTINFVVANVGGSTTDYGYAEIYACPKDAEFGFLSAIPGASGSWCEWVDSREVPFLAPGEQVEQSVTWDVLGSVGDYEICVDVWYPHMEDNKSNNRRCTDTFVLAGGTGAGGFSIR